ncbi:MAG: L-aspartate oxidase [Candidatus Micrarchaeota archaeon]
METDFLVVGSGIAGLGFALKASKLGAVSIATKKDAFVSNTADAQGGIAIPISAADEKKHIEDTLKAGRGICNKEAVTLMVKNAGPRINELVAWGVKFEKEGGKLKRTLEAGHTTPRIIYNADATGRAIEHRLVTLAREGENIELIENSMLVDLIVEKKRCLGGLFLSSNSEILPIFSKFTVLATGGCGQLYEKTTNPHVATGDGYAAAKRSGAMLENMEFMQFHPTKLDVPSSHPFLISEVMRGEGGELTNAKGDAFMKEYDPLGELAPRDVVARAIFIESQKGKVYLDMTHKSAEFLKARFPTIYTKCLGYDIDLAEDRVPVTAAAHYMCGGVKTDLRARASIQNLYAIGEAACTGVHGANRLASNSLLEAMVFSHEAFEDVAGRIGKARIERKKIIKPGISDVTDSSAFRQRIKKLMWEKVGLVRTSDGLRKAILELSVLEKEIGDKRRAGLNPDSLTAYNMVQTSELISTAALNRKASLGCHFMRH